MERKLIIKEAEKEQEKQDVSELKEETFNSYSEKDIEDKISAAILMVSKL